MADKEKSSTESVKAVQKFLKEQGFYKGDISGIKTWGTETAIRTYQVQNKLKNTGEIDDVPTVAMSKSTPAPVTRVNKGNPAAAAQPQAAAPDAAPTTGKSVPQGMIQQGNIDLNTRPVVQNKDGTVSTVRSIGINVNGREVLIPTVSEDGRVMSNAEAVDTFKKTGRHLGMFGSEQDATRYAKQLHEQQAGKLDQSAPPAAPAAAPQDDRVRGLESRTTGRGRPVIPVPPPAPDKPAAPAAPPDAANPDDMPAPDPKTGKPWTAKALAAHIKEIKKEDADQAKRDARAAKDKEIESNAGKPKWTKREEAKANYEARHGQPPPVNWISGAPDNVLADPKTMPPWMRDAGIYDTSGGDIDPKTGFTKPEVWDKLFKGSGKQDEGWTEIKGVGRVSADGRFQQQAGPKGRWGDVTAPLYLTLDRRFGGKDWHTEKAWSGASADEKAAMIRADAGIPTPQVWIIPPDTTAAIGADTAALDGSSVDRMTGRAVPAGARMFSNEYGSGFVSNLPSAPPSQGAGSQVAGPLPGVTPVAQDTLTIIDDAVKATRTKS